MSKSILVAALLLFFNTSHAQQFITEHDTAYGALTGVGNIYNMITNISSNGLPLQWKVTGHDFPADWSGPGNLAICDNALCRTNANNQLLSGTQFTSAPYVAGEPGDFHLMLNLAGASAGTHFVKVQLNSDSQSKEIVFVINHWALSVGSAAGERSPVVYPVPATDEATITGLAGIQRIECVNSYGQKLLDREVVGNELTVSLRDWAPGMYFILYFDKQGRCAGSARLLHR